ncbi:hypothetical protein CT19431_240066 [Cupriavidus taiwanensis]|nr:hypothetical protein CT19431_240066 [Cupriavidus taiwanensis]
MWLERSMPRTCVEKIGEPGTTRLQMASYFEKTCMLSMMAASFGFLPTAAFSCILQCETTTTTSRVRKCRCRNRQAWATRRVLYDDVTKQ